MPQPRIFLFQLPNPDIALSCLVLEPRLLDIKLIHDLPVEESQLSMQSLLKFSR